jgi:rhamnulokinase
MAEHISIAIDMGASSGRHVAGHFNGDRLELSEVHRFDNVPIDAAGTKYWNLLNLWNEVSIGLQKGAAQHSKNLGSIGVDTWGVDFALLGRNDELLSMPVHYRDVRTEGMMDAAINAVTRAEIFAQSGLQFMPINTLYQLMAMQRAGSAVLEAAERFLMMPDLFHWLLTGVKSNEFTNATTTQFLHPTTRTWSKELLQKLSIPTRMFGDVIQPGTVLGGLRSELAAQFGLQNTKVIAPGTHDTASAVLAVPARSAAAGSGQSGAMPDWCYISSGTWSLMGLEIPQPIVSQRCLELNFTNEGGIGNTTRLLKNIGGLWLVQECRRIWKEQGTTYSWDQMAQMASEASPLRSLINPNDAAFHAPKNMPTAIQEFCKKTGQTVPNTVGEVIRTALESLALCYRQVLGWLEELTGAKIKTIHIAGGGTQNRLLSQMTADATGRAVLAGPVEATALGNILMQLVALGKVGSIAEARELVRKSFTVDEFTPQNSAQWNEAYEKYLRVVSE